MAIIAPFRAVRPKPELSAKVAAPPYDVVSLEEARKLADGNPYCFLRVSRAELEMADGIHPYSSAVYAKGAHNLRKLIKDGILFQEEQPLFGVYRQKWGPHQQTGLVALASVEEYDRGIIKKHEHTRPVKETDRVRLIEAHESQSGPVLLFFRSDEKINRWLDSIADTKPDVHFVAEDGVEHTVWSMRDESELKQVVEEFEKIQSFYIADGHHRSAAASRVRATQTDARSSRGSIYADKFLAVLFPHDQLRILPYNRIVRDLHGRTPSQLIQEVSSSFDVQSTSNPGNPSSHGFDMYMEGRWHRAQLKASVIRQTEAHADPVRSLAVSVLTEKVLEPILGISDQRSDPRIEFVGGVRGPDYLAAIVDNGGWAVAFWLYPTTVEELMAVSDAERVMPPKSTWFEPKLRDGLFVHLLRDG